MTCPHCWRDFKPEEVLWVSAHSDLLGDAFLGEDAQQRFLPSRFDPYGKAIDVKGVSCQNLACPHCHLSISWASLQMKPLFVSIVGAPGSGKSYLLASMTWAFRQTLNESFHLSFGDADPVSNQVLSDYEETLFLNPREDDLATLKKTELEGDLYESVRIGDREVWYPRPFLFSIQPQNGHPDTDKKRLVSRTLCLYDNAGEHFLPEGESPRSPMDHLGVSDALMFLFDPTQHPKFRTACKNESSDPQFSDHGWTHRQDQILVELAARIRKYTSWPQDAKYKRPLIVVVTKFDAWSSMLDIDELEINQIVRGVKHSEIAALDISKLREYSHKVRRIMKANASEVVSAAEGFFENVIYVPVSALGGSPEINTETGALGIRPKDVKPMWAEVPLLYALYKSTKRLVYGVRSSKSKS